MNFQYTPSPDPLRVLIVNPLAPAAKLVAVKIMSGVVFGEEQLIDLIFLVYSNELTSAEEFKAEILACGFSCMNSVVITSDLPSVSDADVFCFISNFTNPNYIKYFNTEDVEQFDSIYLILKIANNLSWPEKEPEENDAIILPAISKKKKLQETKERRPIFIADGFITIDILNSFTKNIPSDVFYCMSPLPAISKSVLGDRLKLNCNLFNDVFVWAANDKTFHVEFEKPLVIKDKMDGDVKSCDWDMMSNYEFEELNRRLNLDQTQFGPSWLKKEFIAKVSSISSSNPYGPIFRALEFAKALRDIWEPRVHEGKQYCVSVGIISDGSLDTLKGVPYVLPVIFSGERWTVSTRFSNETHLKQEIQRITVAAQEHHRRLIPYCRKFLEKNVINQEFVPSSSSEYFSVEESTISTTQEIVSSSLDSSSSL